MMLRAALMFGTDKRAGASPPGDARTDEWREEITDRRRVAQILASLTRHGCQGIAHRGERSVPVHLVATHKPEHHVEWQATDELPDGQVSLAVEGYNAVYLLNVSSRSRPDRAFFAPYPTRITKLRQRRDRRVAPEPAKEVTLSGPNGEPLATGLLQNAAYRGVRVRCPAAVSLRPGDRLDLVVDGVFVPDATVHRVDTNEDGAHDIVLLIPAAHRGRWKRLLDRHLHPNTNASPHWNSATWELYRRCGYFNLSDMRPDEFEHLKQSHDASLRLLAGAPELGARVVWPTADREVVATTTTLRVYDHSWLLYQLASERRPRPGTPATRTVLREVLKHTCEHAALDRECRWLLTCVQEKRAWTRRIAYDYPNEQLAPRRQADIVRFRAISIDVPPAPERGIAVAPATAEEATEVAVRLEALRSHAYRDALDLTGCRLAGDRLSHAWRKRGLFRDRVVLTARTGGELTAAAVLEAVADGLHLFHLLDVARLYELAPGGRAEYPALIARAQAWYRTLGKPRFVVSLEDDSDWRRLAPTARDLGAADLCIIPAARIPEWVENVFEITAPLPRSV